MVGENCTACSKGSIKIWEVQTWCGMVKVGIMICDRNKTCTGNKCFKSIVERDGAFSTYDEQEPIEVVGWMACGGCPGERLESAPADMKKYGAEVIYLASCYLAGYPICPYIDDQKN